MLIEEEWNGRSVSTKVSSSLMLASFPQTFVKKLLKIQTYTKEMEKIQSNLAKDFLNDAVNVARKL